MKNKIHYLITILAIISFNQNLLAQNRNIEITSKRNPDKSVDILYTKKLPGSYLVKLEFTTLTNCFEPNIEQIIRNSSGLLTKLKPENSEAHIGYGYKYSTIRGIPNPDVDSLFNYTIPFTKGKEITINEATNLNEKYFGSEKIKSWKSYIVYTNTPDTICSMRKGIVVQITNEHDANTEYKKSYSSERNAMVIEHTDGTYARYVGFKKNSFSVELGQTVYPQTKLGVLDMFNEDNYRLSFSIYYLIDGEIKNLKKQNLKNRKNRYAFVTPYFLTNNGIEQLKNRNKYVVNFDKETLLQEFTRREKKKYKKNPEIFY
jgi:hypothetical protein